MGHPRHGMAGNGRVLCGCVWIVAATRWVWAGACELYFWHIIAAFHFAHDWSHAAAVANVTEASKALIGRPIEVGIWFNYALLVV